MANKPQSQRSKGEVRVRSNLCTDPNDWRFVPGDLLKRIGYSGPMNERQHDEALYYEPCALCRRTVLQIHEGGCDRWPCRNQPGMPSTAEAAARRQREDV